MLTFSCRMRALAALLVVILPSALAQGPSQQKVTSCQSPGTTCMTCTPRYISSGNDCGWCGNVTVGSTNGKCVSQADYKVNPQQCLPSLPPGEGYRTGPPDSACLPLTDLLALIRTIRIIIGVVVGVAILNAICMGIYVKKKRQGTVIQVVGWTALGLFFPLLSWCFMFCCGPTPPASQTPAVMMVGYGQGSAPPLRRVCAPSAAPVQPRVRQSAAAANVLPSTVRCAAAAVSLWPTCSLCPATALVRLSPAASWNIISDGCGLAAPTMQLRVE
jgi:hypothetical protein